jgi:hypothetical protein
MVLDDRAGPGWRPTPSGGDHRGVPGPSSSPPPSPIEAPRRRFGRLWVLAVVASFVGIWGYVLYLSFFVGRAEPRDRLQDTTWAATAEETCADTRRVLDRLELASEVGSPEERADLLDTATDELAVMVTRLEGLRSPRDAAEARAVSRWLDDYRTYLGDRRDYAAAQRDPSHPRYDRPFSVTDRGGYQIDLLIDDFARVNYMESCESPGDV